MWLKNGVNNTVVALKDRRPASYPGPLCALLCRERISTHLLASFLSFF